MTRRVLALAVLALQAACSGSPQRIGDQPSWRRGEDKARVAARPVTFAPASEPAKRYNEPLRPPPPSPLGDAVTTAVRLAAERAGTAVPIPDARLFRACAELAEIVREDVVLAYSLIEFALQRNGIIEPSPYVLVVWGDFDDPGPIVEQLAPQLEKILGDGATARLGVGSARRHGDGSGAVVFALQGSGVATTPIPRALAAGGSFTLDAVIDARYREPEVYVTRDTGVTERLGVRLGHAGSFTAAVACGASTGRQQVEITASGKTGPTVLANFPVWCGAEPPLSLTVQPSSDDEPIADPREAERRMLALVNRDRTAHGLAALEWDDRVADVARAHSEEMRRTKVVAHVSPVTGAAADRVRAASIKTALVLENVARAYGLGEAHQGLMNSPGHRANLTSAQATHLGIGIVLGEAVSGRREIFVTQVFTRVPPKVDPPKAVEQLRAAVAKVRSVGMNPKLDAIAQHYAAQLARGVPREQAYAAVKRQVDAAGGGYQAVWSAVTAASDLDSLDGTSILGGAAPDDVGIGVAQGPHPELGERAIWVVILLATKPRPAK